MGGNLLGWPTLLVILAVVLILFGAPKLPALARSLGQSMRIFRGEMKTMKSEAAEDAAAPAASTEAPADPAPPSSATEPQPPADPKP